METNRLERKSVKENHIDGHSGHWDQHITFQGICTWQRRRRNSKKQIRSLQVMGITAGLSQAAQNSLPEGYKPKQIIRWVQLT